MPGTPLHEHLRDLKIANLAADTIEAREGVLRRLAQHLEDGDLLAATPDQLRQYQAAFATLAPASVNIYTRHIQAFYRWCVQQRVLVEDPSAALIVPKVRQGRPHPTQPDDVRRIFQCTSGALRLAYALAAFAGLRRGEIVRLQRPDIGIDQAEPVLHVDGKGGRYRTVPLIAALVTELRDYGLPRAGYILLRPDGQAYAPIQLSNASTRHLQSLGIESTLHSLRHYFLTNVARLTHDLLFVRDLAGHSSVATTQIYTESTMNFAHQRLAGIEELARAELQANSRPRALRAS